MLQMLSNEQHIKGYNPFTYRATLLLIQPRMLGICCKGILLTHAEPVGPLHLLDCLSPALSPFQQISEWLMSLTRDCHCEVSSICLNQFFVHSLFLIKWLVADTSQQGDTVTSSDPYDKDPS